MSSTGSKLRSEYAIVGDDINLAARFMGMADAGETCCDATTKSHAGSLATYSEETMVVVKGKMGAVPMFRVLKQNHHLASRRTMT